MGKNNQALDRTDAPADGGQTGPGRQVLFGNYVVAFVDVLSQKDKLRQISALSRNEEQREGFIRLLRETFGVIAEYRRLFGEFFDAPQSPRLQWAQRGTKCSVG